MLVRVIIDEKYFSVAFNHFVLGIREPPFLSLRVVGFSPSGPTSIELLFVMNTFS